MDSYFIWGTYSKKKNQNLKIEVIFFFQVETIGDAYMVVSGLSKFEAGSEGQSPILGQAEAAASEIAWFALEMVGSIKTQVRHVGL